MYRSDKPGARDAIFHFLSEGPVDHTWAESWKLNGSTFFSIPFPSLREKLVEKLKLKTDWGTLIKIESVGNKKLGQARGQLPAIN